MAILAVIGIAVAIAILPLIIMGVQSIPHSPENSRIGREPLFDNEK